MRVLFITLSNIGDAVLTMPALSAILENFKDARITLVVSPRAADLFKNDPYLEKMIVYKKNMSLGKKMALIKTLRGIEFDLLVDFKDTMLPFFLYAKRKTPIFKKAPPHIKHMKDKHLWKLKQALLGIQNIDYKPNICLPEEVLKQIDKIFDENNLIGGDKIVAVAPGARSHTKQWSKEGFLRVCQRLINDLGVKIIFLGDQQDVKLSSQIMQDIKKGAVDLCGKTNLKQLAAILKKSSLLITNDSAPAHIAWAVSTPVVAVFGPTNHEKYGPFGPQDIIIRKNLPCSPCQQALCRVGTNECMAQISPEEVFSAARSILGL